MTKALYHKTIFFLALAGVLFSGYLSSIKFFSKTCAFNEPCPYFLGAPACYIGFGIFFVIFLVSISGLRNWVPSRHASIFISVLSALGAVFAGYLTVPELGNIFSGGSYTLLLPSCAYGFFFFILLFILTVFYRPKEDLV